MSTSFDVITKSDRVPTVKGLMDGLFSLPQFASTGIRMNEITVYCLVARDQSETVPQEQFDEIPLDKGSGFVLDFDDHFFRINYHTQETDDDYGIYNRWQIESRALEDAGRALYVAIPCVLAELTDGLTGSGDSAWHNGRDDYTGAEMWDEFVQTELPYCCAKKPFFCPVLNAELEVRAWGRKVTEPYMRRCQEALRNTPDVLLDAICEAAKKYWLDTGYRQRENPVRPVLVTADSPAREVLQYVHFTSLELYEPQDETQVGFGLFGKCDWGERWGIEAVILDNKLIYLGGSEMLSPWEYDKCREEYREACGSSEIFDNRNYALHQPL